MPETLELPGQLIEANFAQHALETMTTGELVQEAASLIDDAFTISDRILAATADVWRDFEGLERQLKLERRWRRQLERELVAARRRECVFNESDLVAALAEATKDGPVATGVIAALLLEPPIEHYHRVRVGKALAGLAERGLARRTMVASRGELRPRWLQPERAES